MRRLLAIGLIGIMLALTVFPGLAAPQLDIEGTNTVTAAVNLAITDVEVTQGIQDLANSMKLIRKRRTIVRVYARNLEGSNVYGIRARIYGREVNATGGIISNLGYIYANNNPITIRSSSGHRLNTDQSFWFYVPASWRAKTRLRLDVEIDYNHTVTDTNLSNNSVSKTMVFYNAEPLNLMMVPMHTHVNGKRSNPTNTYYCNSACVNIYKQVLRYHPISTINAWKMNSALTPISHWAGKEWNPNNDSDQSKMLDRLAWKRFWTNDPISNIHYYGMINQDFGYFGRGNRPGWNSIGTMRNEYGPTTKWFSYGGSIMAHELGHNQGLKHVSCTGTEINGGSVDNSYPWPSPNCSLASVDTQGYYGTDVYYGAFGQSKPTIISNNPNQPAPNRGFPMMGYKSAQWISPWEYCKLMPTYGTSCSWPLANKDQQPLATKLVAETNAIQAAYQGGTGFLMISGMINDSTGEVEINPFYHRTDITPARVQEAIDQRIFEAQERLSNTDGHDHFHQTATSDWTLVLKDSSDSVLYRHMILFDEPVHDAIEVTTGLADIVPMSVGATKIQILRDGLPVFERPITANAPTVQFTTPIDTPALEDGSVITWDAQDADGDELVHTLLYSPDHTNWTPIVTDIPTTGVTLTQELLMDMRGSTAGALKVITSDGVNTTSAEFIVNVQVANKGPQAIILGPEDGQRILKDSEVVLEGTGLDLEDGNLEGASLVWESSLDGPLGTGTELDPLVLSEGKHEITLTATDSFSQSHSQTITVVIFPRAVYLPMVRR